MQEELEWQCYRLYGLTEEEDFDVAALVAELVESESVPFLPVLRYKPTGLRKREVWEQTWDLQPRKTGTTRKKATQAEAEAEDDE